MTPGALSRPQPVEHDAVQTTDQAQRQNVGSDKERQLKKRLSSLGIWGLDWFTFHNLTVILVWKSRKNEKPLMLTGIPRPLLSS